MRLTNDDVSIIRFVLYSIRRITGSREIMLWEGGEQLGLTGSSVNHSVLLTREFPSVATLYIICCLSTAVDLS